MSDRPFAGCPHDGTPLISTIERRGKEWHCMTCGRWLEWLQARGTAVTPETTAQHADHAARFKAGERWPLPVEVSDEELVEALQAALDDAPPRTP